MISSHEGWELCAVYSDEGVSGTQALRRPAFMRMLADAEAGRFDRILTKEVSRFARNTVDALVCVRRLRELSIGVTFLNDGIDTLAPEGELRLTLLSSIAQEESRRTSERVRWGQRRRMEQGVVFGRSPYGYTLKDGVLIPEPEEAEVVGYIFRLYVYGGLGGRSIAARLNAEGVPARYADKWSPAAVMRLLGNEKYTGDLVQGKTCTPDHLSHRRVRCREESELTVIRGHHGALIPRELFDAAARLRQGRCTPADRSSYSARYPLSGKTVCGRCGAGYVSRSKKTKAGVYRSWRCSAACRNASLPDEALKSEVRTLIESTGAPAAAADKTLRLLSKHRLALPEDTVRRAALSDQVLSAAVSRITALGNGEVSIELCGVSEPFRASLVQRSRYRGTRAHGDDLGDTLPADPGSVDKGDQGGRL